MQINGTSKAGENTKTNQQFGTDAATRAGILASVPVITSGGWKALGGSNPAAYDINIFEVFKKVVGTIDTIETDMDLYCIFDGYKYGDWIQNRGLNDANPNGGFYNYAHADDDDFSNSIQNPIGIIEAILRDTTFGLGLTNSQLDLDSFNRASASRSSWNHVFQIQSQEDAQNLLNSLLYQSGSVLYKRNGKVAIWSYANTYCMTNNNMIFDDARLVADSLILDDVQDFEVELYFRSGATPEKYESVISTSETASSDFGLIGRYSTGNFRIGLNNGAGSIVVESSSNAYLADTDYHVIVIKDGADISFTVNGTTDNLSTTSTNVIQIRQFGTWGNFETNYNFTGKLYYARIWSGGDRSAGTLVCDLESINEIPTDKTGTHYFTEYVRGAGDITFELSNKGIYDYYAYASDGEFSQNPIDKDAEFQFGKLNDEIVNDIIYNYYKNSDTGNMQETVNYTDTTLDETIEQEIELDKISELATVALLKTLVFQCNKRRAHFCTLNTQTGIDREIFDIINIRHPRLRNRFADMTSKKWVVVGVDFDGSNMQTILTAVELL
jgi:hypothetical protein